MLSQVGEQYFARGATASWCDPTQAGCSWCQQTAVATYKQQQMTFQDTAAVQTGAEACFLRIVRA